MVTAFTTSYDEAEIIVLLKEPVSEKCARQMSATRSKSVETPLWVEICPGVRVSQANTGQHRPGSRAELLEK